MWRTGLRRSAPPLPSLQTTRPGERTNDSNYGSNSQTTRYITYM
jgi:hypothetical protein